MFGEDFAPFEDFFPFCFFTHFRLEESRVAKAKSFCLRWTHRFETAKRVFWGSPMWVYGYALPVRKLARHSLAQRFLSAREWNIKSFLDEVPRGEQVMVVWMRLLLVVGRFHSLPTSPPRLDQYLLEACAMRTYSEDRVFCIQQPSPCVPHNFSWRTIMQLMWCFFETFHVSRLHELFAEASRQNSSKLFSLFNMFSSLHNLSRWKFSVDGNYFPRLARVWLKIMRLGRIFPLFVRLLCQFAVNERAKGRRKQKN